jgi:hypothetical protein
MLPPMQGQLILKVIGVRFVCTHSYRLAEDEAILNIILRQAILILSRSRGVKSYIAWYIKARLSEFVANKGSNTYQGQQCHALWATMLEDETHKQVGFLNTAHHYSLAFRVPEVSQTMQSDGSGVENGYNSASRSFGPQCSCSTMPSNT